MTPPSSSRSLLLEGGGPSTYAAGPPAMHLSRTAHAHGNVPISGLNFIMNIFISNGWLNKSMTSLQFSIYKSLLEQSTDSILGSSQE